jgi:hypothetical protein
MDTGFQLVRESWNTLAPLCVQRKALADYRVLVLGGGDALLVQLPLASQGLKLEGELVPMPADMETQVVRPMAHDEALRFLPYCLDTQAYAGHSPCLELTLSAPPEGAPETCHEKGSDPDFAKFSDLSMPSECMACGSEIPTGKQVCPVCGWSYQEAP